MENLLKLRFLLTGRSCGFFVRNWTSPERRKAAESGNVEHVRSWWMVSLFIHASSWLRKWKERVSKPWKDWEVEALFTRFRNLLLIMGRFSADSAPLEY